MAEAAAREAGALIKRYVGQLGEEAVRSKGLHDLVTVVDTQAEQVIVEHLRDAFPGDVVLAEERADGAVLVDGRCWIVDPLDGTTNFTHGVPPYAVSIALRDDRGLAVGVVYDVAHGELFVAARGEGLLLNGAPAHVSRTETLDTSLVATGFPFRDYRYADGYLASFETLMRGTRGLRRHGAASVDLAWVACGRFDAFFEAGLAPWDLAAGCLLVSEGGGQVTGLPEGRDPVVSGGVLASNGRVHAALGRATVSLGSAYTKVLDEGG